MTMELEVKVTCFKENINRYSTYYRYNTEGFLVTQYMRTLGLAIAII